MATNGNWTLQAATEWLQVAIVDYRWQLEAISGNCMVTRQLEATSSSWVATSGNWGMQVGNVWLQVATRGFKQKPCGYK